MKNFRLFQEIIGLEGIDYCQTYETNGEVQWPLDLGETFQRHRDVAVASPGQIRFGQCIQLMGTRDCYRRP